MAADVGTGATVVFGTTGFSANVTGINHSGLSRAAIDTSYLGTTGGRTFIPGDLYDPGQLTLEIDFDPASVIADEIYSTAAETVTVTFPDASTLSGSAFCTNLSFGVPLEDKQTGSVTLDWAGDLAWS